MTVAAYAPRDRSVIGPNAVIQLIDPLRELDPPGLAQRVFECAGLAAYLEQPPGRMVPEGEVRSLFDAVQAVLGSEAARSTLHRAGQGTAVYIMANRIPAAVSSFLRILPPRPATWLLSRAIERNSWTFAGSGRCGIAAGPPVEILIAANPIATPGCPWHRGVFSGLYRALVSPEARVHHPDCCALGGDACRFVISRT